MKTVFVVFFVLYFEASRGFEYKDFYDDGPTLYDEDDDQNSAQVSEKNEGYDDNEITEHLLEAYLNKVTPSKKSENDESYTVTTYKPDLNLNSREPSSVYKVYGGDANAQDKQETNPTFTKTPEVNKEYEEKASSPLVYDLKEAPILFRRFVEDYGKSYKNEADYKKHFKNFVHNLEEINKMNAQDGSATFEVNMFADLSDDEMKLYKRGMLG